jgi:hypothetical protein
MIATAIVAVHCAEIPRARALLRRAAFHAREKQTYLLRAQRGEKRFREVEGTWRGQRARLTAIIEDDEAVLEHRERAEYHAELEASYRRAAWYPWYLAPAEEPFRPDGWKHSPEWLRAKAEGYRSLEEAFRRLAARADEQGAPERAREYLRIAERDARIASDYDRGAEEARRLVGSNRSGPRDNDALGAESSRQTGDPRSPGHVDGHVLRLSAGGRLVTLLPAGPPPLPSRVLPGPWPGMEKAKPQDSAVPSPTRNPPVPDKTLPGPIPDTGPESSKADSETEATEGS